MSQGEILDVPTNVITGFLGAGKTTAILHLLAAKPADERWAVLVNEFGEVGIDGGMLGGETHEEQGLFVREVPGGCMCCAAGVPMQIALTSLLSQARPQRLLIEPTGLGHPKEVLGVLTADHYRRVLDLRATVALVDARKIRDPRYREHPTFIQQLAVADLIAANKADCYGPEDLSQLRAFLDRTDGLAGKTLKAVEQGAVDLAWLDAPAGDHARDAHHHHAASAAALPPVPQIPEEGFLRIDNQGDDFFSSGWMFDPRWQFDPAKLETALSGIDAERIKAVFITTDGIAAYNISDGVMTKSWLPDAIDSRVEVISMDRAAFDGLEECWMRCVAHKPKGSA